MAINSKGVSKPKVKGAGKGRKGSKRGKQQPQPPIHLPTDALAEVFEFLPRDQRAQLALISSQAAEAILPGLKAERQKVSPCFTPPTTNYHSYHNSRFSPPPRASLPATRCRSMILSSSARPSPTSGGIPWSMAARPSWLVWRTSSRPI